MPFNELVFLAFIAVVVAVHRLPLSWRVRKFNLLWLSYLFYAAWNPPFVILLWISTVVDWSIGRRLHAAESIAVRRVLLLVSLVVNLGLLSYFKYGGFLVENTAALMAALGSDWQPATPSIVLPIGISFYTFQTLSYTLDIYQRRIKPWDDFLDYALFVTFFPQLVAGPIVRARQFLPQCRKPTRVSGAQFAWGSYLFVIGVFEKVVIADGVLAPAVETVFDNSLPVTGLDSWVASFGFAAQIFCDFSGYSLCAIGVAKCLGFTLPMNFRFPLAAIGFAAFWRRWHISLSSWLRDYVYASLRGAHSEGQLLRWAWNILITWTLIGLWHGAGWNFLLWGLLSGAFLVTERLLRTVAPRTELWTRTPMQFGFAVVQFTGFACSALLFRAPTTERMTAMGTAMLTGAPADRSMLLNAFGLATVTATTGALFLSHWFLRDSSLESVAARTPWPVKAVVLALMIVSVVIIQARDRAFLYFQF